ncbi:MAG: hypothetical protein GXY86_13650 [Firmicutes bacterium]|nr:hypothetical protein [Bacillota bacterium]
MKHKLFKYAIVLILMGCLAMPAFGADSQDAPVFKTLLSFKSLGRWFPGQVVNLELFAYNLQDIQKFRMDVKYNPNQLRLVYVSRGTFLVEGQGLAEWNSGVVDHQQGLAAKISGIRTQSFNGKETILIRLNFVVTGAGNGQITLENSKIISSKGIEREFDFTPLQYQIEQEK